MRFIGKVFRFWALALVIVVTSGLVKGFVPPEFSELFWGSTSSIALLALVAFSLRRDRRTWEDVGLAPKPSSGVRFAMGLVVGIGTFALTVLLISFIGGPIRLAPGNPSGASLFPLMAAGFLALGAMEELMFRSYAFWTAIDAVGPKYGQVLVALAFGLMHLAYGWTWISVVSGVIPSALLFGAAAWASRGLAWPLGIHVGMNVALWLAGEKDRQGPWRLELTAADPGSAALWAPYIGAAVSLMVSALFWWWGARRRLLE